MNDFIDTSEFVTWDYERIKVQMLNIADGEIERLERIRIQIIKVLDYVGAEEFPVWFNEVMDYIIKRYLAIVKIRTNQNNEIRNAIDSFSQNLTYGRYDGPNRTNNNFTLPFLEDYARTKSIEKKLAQLDTYDKFDTIGKFTKQADSVIENQKVEYSGLKSQIEKSLELVNKEVGKLGVQQYAEIFDHQAKEHSSFRKTDPEESKWKVTIGKAQLWLLCAFVCVAGLIYAFTKLDSFFEIGEALTFTPKITIHVFGRIIFISLFIFLISFCFKQYRVNMHLYTLNKHRANTLKSFEYLSRAPDPLEPSSYNAILMEVARAIYESGQTGYISNNESNGDMPSIIDMTKIFNNPRP